MMFPVEAKSLTSLINLAANPPQYPRNITHEPLQPLTLYIVRVPGSQDVFLTPLKPPTRASISVDAITTSLYFLHVSTEEDKALSAQQQSPIEQVSPATSINRKPLPTTTYTNESHQRPSIPPNSYPDYQPRSPDAQDDRQDTKYDFRGQNIRLDTRGQGGHSISRKPLGPRPLHGRIQSSEEGSIKRKPVANPQSSQRSRANTVGSVDPADILEAAERPVYPDMSTPSPQAPANEQEIRDSFAPSGSDKQASHDVHITIIRRDPGSGTQWNVGTISTSGDPFADNNRIEIQIATPGYQRFARDGPLPKLEDLDLLSLSRNKENLSPHALKLNTAAPTNEPDVFTRHLTMPRPKPKTNRRRSSSDPTAILQSSFSKVTSPAPATRPPVYVPHLNPPPASSQQHFTFVSPWQGTCTYSTTMDGRSLKCRHVLPSSASPEAGVHAPAPVVGELRFNLPWPSISFDALKRKDASYDKDADRDSRNRPSLADTAKASWRSSMQKIKDVTSNPPRYSHERQNSSPTRPTTRHANSHNRQHSRQQSSEIDHNLDTDSDDEQNRGQEDQFDLSLGREKAGGGRGGQSAKLGKLILRDEGLKMMDLVVAASMGVWWGIHNRGK